MKLKALCFNQSNQEERSIMKIVGWQPGSFPTQHLGAPLQPTNLTVERWNLLLIMKIDRRLALWKVELLSFEGHARLNRHALLTILSY